MKASGLTPIVQNGSAQNRWDCGYSHCGWGKHRPLPGTGCAAAGQSTGAFGQDGCGKVKRSIALRLCVALDQGYQGIVTIDGNDKDDPQAIPRFIGALKDGVDFVQASRFIPEGIAENTPKLRDF